MRAPVYEQVCDALADGGFWVELDAQIKHDPSGEAVGAAVFQLRARRPADGHVVGASQWLRGTEAAAVSLATELLMLVDPQIRIVVGKLQL